MYRFGLALFLLAEVIIFLTLFSIRFLLAGSGHPSELSQVAGGAVTLLMLLSVVPAIAALRASRRNERAALVGSLLVTAFIGVLVVSAMAVEWATLDLSPGSRFGGVFLTALGVHALHVVAAAAALYGVAIQVRRRLLTPSASFAVEGSVLFWLVVVGLWVALWAVFYLL